MTECRVSIWLADGFVVQPDSDVSSLAAELEMMAELGAHQVNSLSYDRDLERSIDQCGSLADLAAAAGLGLSIELCPGFVVADVATALSVAAAVNRPNFGLLIDTMHVARSGGGPADLAAIDPSLIHYAQICDAPARPRPSGRDYLDEALTDRLVPGAGEIDLAGMLAAIPADVVIGIEVPQVAAARAGVSAADRMRPCVDATRELLAGIGRSGSSLRG